MALAVATPLAVDIAEAVGLARVQVNDVLIVSSEPLYSTPSYTALTVAISATAAAALPQSVRARRFVLRVGHTIYANDTAAADPAKDELLAEWNAVSSAAGIHPHVCRVFACFRGGPPREAAPFLPPAVTAALSSGTARVTLMLTEQYSPADYSAVPRPLAFPSTFGVALGLLRASAHLHSQGVVHAAIRPAALAVAGPAAALASAGTSTADRTLLCGFKYANKFSAGDRSMCQGFSAAAAAVGPALAAEQMRYLAPEVHTALRNLARAKEDPRRAGSTVVLPLGKTDAWACAVTLLELLTGAHPFPGYGTAPPATAPPLALAPFKAALQLPPDYPLAFSELLRWLLHPDPSQRLSAAGAVQRLETLASGKPTAVIPLPLPEMLDGAPGSEGVLRLSELPAALAIPPEALAAGGSVAVVFDGSARLLGPDAPLPIARLQVAQADGETVAVVTARAAEVLGVAQRVSALSLLAGDDRIDPLAPFPRLPSEVRGAALRLVPGVSALAPTVTVPGFGAAAAPTLGQMGLQMLGADAVMAAPRPAAAEHGMEAGGAGGANGGAAGPADMPAAPVAAHGAGVCSFSRAECGAAIMLSEGNTVATNKATWSSVLLSQGKIKASADKGAPTRYIFGIRILALESGGGIAVGMVDPQRFNPQADVFGAKRGSWGYSRTGAISNGDDAGWIEYGESFVVGDVITTEVVLSAASVPRMRFFKNGVLQGVAFRGQELLTEEVLRNGRKEHRPIELVPAVCLGSTGGGKLTRVQLCNAEVLEFDRDKAHHRIQFSEDCVSVWNSGKWATVLGAHPGARTGKLSWSIRLDDTRHGAGVAVGVVDADQFDFAKQNLGASANSWCYSKTGKKGDGSGFLEYAKPFSNGDVITVNLDMDACTLSFAYNGEDQGVAYDATHGIGTCPLVPAVCLGSTDGNKEAKVSIVGAPVLARRFNRFACNKKVTLKDRYTVAETNDKWGTVFVEHPGIRNGRFSYGVHITSAGQGCGAAIGFADADRFNAESKNLGAAPDSWCYSKTGKYSSGGGFMDYGAPYKTGDVITAEVDMVTETFKFYVNGKDQGGRKAEGIRNCTLVPAIVLGSTDGGHFTQVTLTMPAVTRFDPRRMNKHMQLRDDDRTCCTESRWCTVLADHPGVSSGVLRFAVRVEHDGGAAVGFAEAGSFKPYSQNLGASPNTWAISKTGKVSCGDAEGFHPFSEKFGAGDVIGAEADMIEGIIRFWKNGILLGTAFQGLQQRKQSQTLCLVPAVCLGSNPGGKMSSATLVEFELAWMR